MADIWMDVDTALAEVPVNFAPLIDDTDFKTIEDAVAYNATGMDLRWNFLTCAGAYTSTAVTPTTGGAYDWAHQGDGMYSIEIPASGGASINNDTEGFGWFSGKATGVLPWRGPVIGFRAAALNDALIDGGDVLDVNLVQVLATALTETAGGYLAAGIKKFFDVASPTSTMNLITAVTTATNLTNLPAKVLKYFQLLFRKDAAIATDNAMELTEINANGGSGAGAYDNTTDSQEGIRDTAPLGTAMRGTDNAALASDLATLLTRLSELRAGYLDNLNVGGNVASSAEVTAVQNNTRVVRVVPTVIERPDAGTTTYRIELLLYDAVGNMEAPDSAPTIALVDQGGTDLSARLDSTTMALVSTGRYRAVYTASSTDDLEQLVWTFSVVEGGATRLYGNTTLIVDTTAVDFTSADRTKLEALNTDWTDGGRLDLLIDAILEDTGTTLPALMAASALRNALGLASANLDTQLAALLNLLEADMFVDTTTSPWTLCIRQKGTATNLLVKNLKTVAGANITDAETAVGQEIHVP